MRSKNLESSFWWSFIFSPLLAFFTMLRTFPFSSLHLFLVLGIFVEKWFIKKISLHPFGNEKNFLCSGRKLWAMIGQQICQFFQVSAYLLPEIRYTNTNLTLPNLWGVKTNAPNVYFLWIFFSDKYLPVAIFNTESHRSCCRTVVKQVPRNQMVVG